MLIICNVPNFCQCSTCVKRTNPQNEAGCFFPQPTSFLCIRNMSYGSFGMMSARIKYKSQPKPGMIIARMRIMIGSMFKYSPIPPQTPAIQRLLRDLYKRFISMFFIPYPKTGLAAEGALKQDL